MSNVLTPVAHPKIRLVSERPTYVKALIYGDAGSGKTFLGATAPDALILLTEPSVSDTTLKAVKGMLGYNPAVWELESLDDLSEAYEFLTETEHSYKTVVLDSLTDLFRRTVRKVLGVAVERAMEKGRVHDPDVPEQGDWFRIAEKLRYVTRAFRDLPMNVVFTALVMDIRNEMRKVPFVQPKSFALELPAFFNLVGYLGVSMEGGESVRKLLVTPTDTFVAKNPGGALPDVVENPDLRKIFTEIQNQNLNEKESVVDAEAAS